MSCLFVSVCLLFEGIRYSGALIEPNGDELSNKRMEEFCSTQEYRVITVGTRVSGTKKFTTTIVFECIE